MITPLLTKYSSWEIPRRGTKFKSNIMVHWQQREGGTTQKVVMEIGVLTWTSQLEDPKRQEQSWWLKAHGYVGLKVGQAHRTETRLIRGLSEDKIQGPHEWHLESWIRPNKVKFISQELIILPLGPSCINMGRRVDLATAHMQGMEGLCWTASGESAGWWGCQKAVTTSGVDLGQERWGQVLLEDGMWFECHTLRD